MDIVEFKINIESPFAITAEMATELRTAIRPKWRVHTISFKRAGANQNECKARAFSARALCRPSPRPPRAAPRSHPQVHRARTAQLTPKPRPRLVPRTPTGERNGGGAAAVVSLKTA